MTGAVVIKKALKIFRKRSGRAVSLNDHSTLQGRLLHAQIAAITEVVDEHQSTINKVGVGFKGFVPAVFARLVNEKFKRKIGQFAEIKVTAPMALVRNRKARPDKWESDKLRNKLMRPDWTKGELYSEQAKNSGREAFRALVPEYFGTGCLACHGGPRAKSISRGIPRKAPRKAVWRGPSALRCFGNKSQNVLNSNTADRAISGQG